MACSTVGSRGYDDFQYRNYYEARKINDGKATPEQRLKFEIKKDLGAGRFCDYQG